MRIRGWSRVHSMVEELPNARPSKVSASASGRAAVDIVIIVSRWFGDFLPNLSNRMVRMSRVCSTNI